MTTTDYFVSGMTCNHCVSSVTEEISAIGGVDSIEVFLNFQRGEGAEATSGVSRVTVTSATPLDAAAVTAAIQEAGYQLASTP